MASSGAVGVDEQSEEGSPLLGSAQTSRLLSKPLPAAHSRSRKAPGAPLGWQGTRGRAAVPEQGPVPRWSTNPWLCGRSLCCNGDVPSSEEDSL